VTSTAAPVSGQVQLTEGSTDRGTATLAGGAATFRLPVGLSGGIHTLTAAYSGSDDLAPASTTVTVTVVLPAAWSSTQTYATGGTVSYNGQVYAAAWSTKGEQPGKTATGAWQQMSMTEDGAAVWTASRIFHTGDRVDYQGRTFEAAWYSRGDTPGSVTGPWEEIATAPDGTAIWTATRIFDTGDVVLYNGQKYTARWYSRNQVPGTPNSAWK
jgi:chondroitin AC lyase